MKKTVQFTFALLVATLLAACDIDKPKTSDDVQQQAQERMLAEGTMKTGMPGIVNFRERKLLKMILELRDQEGLTTYTYLENMQPAVVKGKTALGGKLTYLGVTIGYGIPYATQYTNPQKVDCYGVRDTRPGYAWLSIPQADPNGLFSPASAEGTWVMMKNPKGKEVLPLYVEPRIISSPFPLEMD